MAMQLEGKVIVVTGAFGQVGRAVVAEVLRQGAAAALLDVVAGSPPEGAHAWKVDLKSLDGVREVLDDVVARFGRIDGLVNVAGGFRWTSLEDCSDLGDWEAMFSMNLMTCVTPTKAALPHLLRQGGRIVNVGAAGAVKAAAGMGPYAASKAGVARFTEALADELKLRGVNVNAVLPSIVDTPQNRADMPDADFSRWVPPQDIARAIGLLLSDAAAAVTGALVPVTGRT